MAFDPVGDNLWLYGGFAIPTEYPYQKIYSDLWQYSLGLGMWAWKTGKNTYQRGDVVALPTGGIDDSPVNYETVCLIFALGSFDSVS